MKINNKIDKFTALLLISIFVGSMVWFMPTEPLSNLPLESQESALFYSTWGLGTRHIPSNLRDMSLPTTVTKQSVVDPNEFYLSESIKTEIEFNKQAIDFQTVEFSAYGNLDYPEIFALLDREEGLDDDGDEFQFQVKQEGMSGFGGADLVFDTYLKIYCGGAGALYTEYRGYWSGSGGGTYTTLRANTETITSSMIDNLGYLYLLVRVSASDNDNTLVVRIYHLAESGLVQLTAVEAVSIT